MHAFFAIALVGLAVAGAVFIVTRQIAHAALRHHPAPIVIPLPTGQTRERATALADESERYRNYLTDRLIPRGEERHPPRRGGRDGR